MQRYEKISLEKQKLSQTFAHLEKTPYICKA